MQKRVLLAMALVGLLLPALALAAPPLLVCYDGHAVPVQEAVHVTHANGGTVRVYTWSWHGPNGAGTVEVQESRGGRAPLPDWALAQMREMQLQMQQLQRIEAALERPLLAPPLSVAFSQPLLIPLPGVELAPPLQLRILQPVIATPAPPGVVTVIEPPATRAESSPVPARHQGMRT